MTNVDPNGNLFWLITLIVGAAIGGLITGTVNAVTTAINGGSFLDSIGSFVGGFFTGFALSGAAILGGMLAVGTIAVSAVSIITSLVAVTVGSFVFGIGSNLSESAIKGNTIDWGEALNEGGITLVQGLLNYGLGAVLGSAGLWESLRSGQGFGAHYQAAKEIMVMEIGKGGIRGLINGVMSYMGTNLWQMIARTFYRQIFTFPWNFLKP